MNKVVADRVSCYRLVVKLMPRPCLAAFAVAAFEAVAFHTATARCWIRSKPCVVREIPCVEPSDMPRSIGRKTQELDHAQLHHVV